MDSKSWIITAVLIATVSLLASFFAIKSGKQDSQITSQDTLARIQRTGNIEACTVVNPPFSIKDSKTGERSGYNIDVLNLIAKKMDAHVNWHESTWGNAAIDLTSNRCDIVAAEFFANIPRAKAVAFTKPPLFYIGTAAVARKGDVRFENINSVFDLDKSNITVAVSTGEAGDIFVKEHFRNASVRRIDVEASDITRFILEVTAGRADIAIAGQDVVDLYISVHNDIVDVFKNKPFGLNPVGWAVRPDDHRWLNFIETSLQFLGTQGDLQDIEKKYNVKVLHQKKEFLSE